MQNVYGYINNSGSFVETGFTEKGAKIAATRQGFDEVGYRSPINNMYVKTGAWCPIMEKWLEVVY